MDMNEQFEEIEATIKSAGDSAGITESLDKEEEVNCDVCDSLFIPKHVFLTMCDECKLSMKKNIKDYDKLNSANTSEVVDILGLYYYLFLCIWLTLSYILEKTTDKNESEDTVPNPLTKTNEKIGDTNGSVENVDRDELTQDPIGGAVEDLKEELSTFSSDHMHYRNLPFKSAETTYQMLVDKDSKKENLELYFNSSLIVAKSEFSQTDFYKTNVTPETNYVCFVTNDENSGEYEGRTYYGYDCLVAIGSKSTKRGYICPSIIIETGEDGKSRDTGQRLHRLLRTRCVRPQIHAIIYYVEANVIKIVKKGFMQYMNQSRYTACHLPFKYDDAVKK